MMNKGFLLATAGGVLAASGGAQAADLPMKAAPYMAPAVASWQGLYWGVNAGAAWQRMGYSNDDAGGQTFSGTSFIGGGQLGYNWQHGTLVYGVEADISGLTHGARQAERDPTKGDFVKSDINWLATFRGRAGLAVADTMVYATAGLAVGGVKNTFAPEGTFCVGNCSSKSQSKTKVGWAVGGGVEHMWTRNWTIGLEALFVDLGSSTVNFKGFSGDNKSGKFSNQAVIARAKLNYKF